MTGATPDPTAPARELCAFCPKLCRDGCPVAVAEGSEAATPAAKGVLIRLHEEGVVPLAGALAESVYRCTDCRLQEQHCLHGVVAPDAYAPVRERAMEAGVAPERAMSYAARVRRLGNPFREGLARDLAALAAGRPMVASGARAANALYPGCAAVARVPALVTDALAVLDRVGDRAGEAPVAPSACGAGCCGYPLLAAGDRVGFRRLAAEAARALAGVGTVIVLEPGCAHAMTQGYRDAGVAFAPRVTTLVEHLAERIEAVRALVTHPLEVAVAYHDPCFLGRWRGVYDAPRALLAAAAGGAAPRELPTARERAFCSGAGGVYRKVWPEGGTLVAARRLGEAAEAAAPVLATACPSAQRHLTRTLAGASPSAAPGPDAAPREVADVVQLLARSFGLS